MSNGKYFQEIEYMKPGVMATINMWNRVEGRPRTGNFNRALKAELRDALWMLTKQWQMGEFNGDDAGSPILAKACINKKRLEKYQAAANPAQPYHNNIPLEGMVEQLPIPFEYENKPFSLDLRMMMGRYWLKLIGADKTLADQYARKYPVQAPISPDSEEDAKVLAHPETWQKFAAAASRKMDGYEFYLYLTTGKSGAGDVEIDDEDLITQFVETFKSWVEHFFLQPDNDGNYAYLPSHLEYQFSCSASENGSEKVYKAEEYYSGRLDWYNLSLDDSLSELKVESGVTAKNSINEAEEYMPLGDDTFAFIPANIEYEGMPDTRWWKFEDRNTYLGDVKLDTTDISKLFLEFTLFYANDWFMVPQTLPTASISNIRGLVVTNCFGERTWIGPSGQGPDDDWQRWTMFTIDKKGKDLREADNSLVILPTVPKIQEGPAVEKAVIIRDEIANMVWAIEAEITLASGDRKKGTEAARELTAFYNRLYPEPEELEKEPLADIRYKIMNTVPENWIPFIPVHIPGQNREVQLQRASMPRILFGAENNYQPVKPRTFLLREGLDKEIPTPYYIFEEEIPRSGIQMNRSYQRTRWYNGRTYLWLGIHKKIGRGQGSSGLRFDYLKNMI